MDQSYSNKNLVLSKKEINDFYSIKARLAIEYMYGNMITYIAPKDPVVINEGERVDYQEFIKAQNGEKSTCDLKDKNYLYFDSMSAIALYGEEAEGGLYLFTNFK